MRAFVLSATAATLFASNALAHPECLRPKWTECVSLPNGGRHTGIDPYGATLDVAVPADSVICVSNEWEIMADTYVQFSRNGAPWPHRDWEVRVETFCFYERSGNE